MNTTQNNLSSGLCGRQDQLCCVTVNKIFDSAKDKDCLEDLRVYLSDCAQEIADRATAAPAPPLLPRLRVVRKSKGFGGFAGGDLQGVICREDLQGDFFWERNPPAPPKKTYVKGNEKGKKKGLDKAREM